MLHMAAGDQGRCVQGELIVAGQGLWLCLARLQAHGGAGSMATTWPLGCPHLHCALPPGGQQLLSHLSPH